MKYFMIICIACIFNSEQMKSQNISFIDDYQRKLNIFQNNLDTNIVLHSNDYSITSSIDGDTIFIFRPKYPNIILKKCDTILIRQYIWIDGNPWQDIHQLTDSITINMFKKTYSDFETNNTLDVIFFRKPFKDYQVSVCYNYSSLDSVEMRLLKLASEMDSFSSMQNVTRSIQICNYYHHLKWQSNESHVKYADVFDSANQILSFWIEQNKNFFEDDLSIVNNVYLIREVSNLVSEFNNVNSMPMRDNIFFQKWAKIQSIQFSD